MLIGMPRGSEFVKLANAWSAENCTKTPAFAAIVAQNIETIFFAASTYLA
jgi:hypothetical protein